MVATMLAHICASTVLAADPAITVSAKQRYPWNGLVDLQFTITGTSGTKYDTSFTAKDVIGGTNITMKTIRKADGAAANVAKEQLLPGTYNWVWDATADLPKDWVCDRVTVTGTAVEVKYYVKFNANGGSGNMPQQQFAIGESQQLSANVFTKSKYTFFGWSKDTTAVRAYNDKQSVMNLTTTANGIVNLYAIWTISSLANGLNCTTLPWRTGDSNAWYYNTAESRDGTASVKSSGAGGGEADSWLETTVKGPATISFYYAKKHYSSTFTIKRGSTTIFTDSTGTSDEVSSWIYKSFAIPSGTYNIRFNYHHSGIGYGSGGNGIRIDQFKVTYN